MRRMISDVMQRQIKNLFESASTDENGKAVYKDVSTKTLWSTGFLLMAKDSKGKNSSTSSVVPHFIGMDAYPKAMENLVSISTMN